MNLGSWKINDLVTFTVNTHNTSGVETDADAVPAYRVYEDETGTPILTGSMAKLDDANTTGFYSEQITLSAANGFEKGKSYNIRISAAVGGITGCTLRTLQIEAEVDANVVSDKTGYSGTATNMLAAADVWGHATRTLSAFGFNVTLADASLTTAKLGTFALAKGTNLTGFNDIAAADVWAVGTRTLTGFTIPVTLADGSLTTAKLGTFALAKGTNITGFNDIAAGAAMTLTVGERDAIATEVEEHLLNEGDSQMLINAIVGAIGNVNVDEVALVAAIRADLERSGGNLNTVISRLTAQRATNLDNLDAAITVRTIASADYATAANLTIVNNNVLTVDTVADSIKVTTDKLDTAMQLDGAVYRFTANALELAPTGSGGPVVTVEDIVDGILNEPTVDHTTAGTVGAAIRGTYIDIATVIANQGVISTNITTVNNNVLTVDTVVDSIKVATDKLNTAMEVDGGVYRFTANSLELAPVTVAGPTLPQIVDGILNEATANHTTVGTVGAAIRGTYTDVATVIANQTTINTNLTTVNNNVLTVDTVVDFIKPVTDKLNTAMEVDGGVYRFTTNSLEQAPTSGGSTAPTVDQIVDGILNELLAGHNVAGSVGEALLAAGAAGDPLLGIVEPAGGGNPAVTLRDTMRLIASFLMGESSGGGTETISFSDINGVKTRLVMTVDTVSNRISVTRDVA